MKKLYEPKCIQQDSKTPSTILHQVRHCFFLNKVKFFFLRKKPGQVFFARFLGWRNSWWEMAEPVSSTRTPSPLLPHTHIHTQTLTLTHSLTLSHIYTLSHRHTVTRSLSLNTFTHTHTPKSEGALMARRVVAQNVALFFLHSPRIPFAVPSLGACSWNSGDVFEASGPSKKWTFGVLLTHKMGQRAQKCLLRPLRVKSAKKTNIFTGEVENK